LVVDALYAVGLFRDPGDVVGRAFFRGVRWLAANSGKCE
jgi:hypothetical protein